MRTRIQKPPIGARPGTLAIGPGADQPVVRVFSYDEDNLEELDLIDIESPGTTERAGRKLWVDVRGLGDEPLLRRLAGLFSIHPLALEDIVNSPVRPKVEPYEDNLLIVTRMVRPSDHGTLAAEQVSIILGNNFVLTFQERSGDSLDPVRKRLLSPSARMRRSSSDYLGYAVLDTIIDSYYPIVEELGDRLENLEELVLTEAPSETPRELSSVKAELLVLRRAIAPQREAVQALIRGGDQWISDEVRVYLRDTQDHVVQLAETVEYRREFAGGLVNLYLSMVSNRMNEVMKTLTIVASIFIPLTFLAGIYGMNFEYLPELGFRWAYPVLLGIMAVVTGGMIFYFWRKGWIGR